MQQKTLLLASFVKEEKLESLISRLKNNFNIDVNNIFFFMMENGDRLLTYKLQVEVDRRIDIKNELPKTIQIHKKGDTIFTINALNKLIEIESGLEGNVNHKEYQIDWSKFKNKIILLKGEVLEITNIERIFLPKS